MAWPQLEAVNAIRGINHLLTMRVSYQYLQTSLGAPNKVFVRHRELRLCRDGRYVEILSKVINYKQICKYT